MIGASRRWALVVVAVLLIVAHGFLLRLLTDRKWPVVIALAVIILVAIKHFGLLRALYARLGTQRRNAKPRQ